MHTPWVKLKLMEFDKRSVSANKYGKSYERKCISGFMSTSDVLKVLKIAGAVAECNLRNFKTSRVTINLEMHKQVHTIFFYYIFNKITQSLTLL